MDKKFIEIKRVFSDENKVNISSNAESIDIDLIQSFRGWHKGRNDQQISGDMTLIVLKNTDEPEFFVNEETELNGSMEVEQNRKILKKVKTILIQESYSKFIERMSARVVVRRLE